MLGSSQSGILKTLLYAPEGVNIDGLSQKLGISRNATYQHVKTLERDGLIARHDVEKTKGRPGQTYRLTREGQSTFTQSYSLIATLLVSAVKQDLGEKRLTAILESLGHSLAEGVEEDLASMSIEDRVSRISEIMKSLGYETILETDGLTPEAPPQIVAHHCVFHNVAEEYPEVCSMDLALLESLSACRVEHCECIVRGGRTCRFKFQPKS